MRKELFLIAVTVIATPLGAKLVDNLTNGGVINLLKLRGIAYKEFSDKVDIFSHEQYAAFANLRDCEKAGEASILAQRLQFGSNESKRDDFRQVGFKRKGSGPNPLTGNYTCTLDKRYNEVNWALMVASIDQTAVEIRNELTNKIKSHPLNLRSD